MIQNENDRDGIWFLQGSWFVALAELQNLCAVTSDQDGTGRGVIDIAENRMLKWPGLQHRMSLSSRGFLHGSRFKAPVGE